MTNATLREVLRVAYHLQDFQITGGPRWIASERFDIAAKAEGELPPLPAVWPTDGPPAPVFLMVRSLLADRFKLIVHSETRETPVYALVMARTDRRPGPQLRASEIDCGAFRAARSAAQRTAPTAPPPPPLPGERPTCGAGGGPGRFAAGAMPIAALAANLSMRLNRAVLDRTDLAGNFDITLEFTPDQLPPGAVDNAPPNGPPPAPADGPSLFTALQEQLGLKLEPRRGPVEFLVIDQVDRPTGN